MNYIFKIIISLSGLTIGIPNISAQDTICFKNQGLLSAKILEVTMDQISYKHTSDSSGFIYKADKNRITYIKYRNGMVDTIKALQQAPVKIPAMEANDIEIHDEKLVYQGKRLSDRKLKFLIDNCAGQHAKDTLKKEFSIMKMHERNQKIIAPLGLLTGFGIVVATAPIVRDSDRSVLDYSPETWKIAFAGIVSGAVIRIASHVFFKISQNKRYHKRNDIARLYNILN